MAIPEGFTRGGHDLDPPAEVAPRSHHPYSPSTLQSLEACPCYQSRDNKHARTIIGTISHNVAETGVDDARLDDDDAAAVAECLDFYEKRRQGALEFRNRTARLHIEDDIPEIIELKETNLPIDNCEWEETITDFKTGEKTTRKVTATTAGFIDAAIISHCRTYAEIFDWKFGMWSVEKADNNLQGIAYALGMLKMYPTLKSVLFWFKQPNTNGLSHCLIKREDIAKFYLRIQVIVERAKRARASGNFDMANPMVPNCNFCANIGACTKVTGFICKVGSKFHPLAIPADITPSMVHSPHDTKLGMMLAQVAAVWAKAYRSQVTDRTIGGRQPMPEGYFITQKSDREIIDAGKYKTLALAHLTPEEYETTLTPAFGAVEELISAKAPRGQKKHTLDAFKQKLEEEGAVKRGEPYSFLKAISSEKEKDTQQPTQ
jgi:hypothetical protein